MQYSRTTLQNDISVIFLQRNVVYRPGVNAIKLFSLLIVPGKNKPGPIGRPMSGNTKRGEHHCTVDLLFDWFGLVCFANNNKNCQLSYSLFQTSQTGGQQYSNTSPFSIPCLCYFFNLGQNFTPTAGYRKWPARIGSGLTHES